MIYAPEFELSKDAVDRIIESRAEVFMADCRYRVVGNHIHAYARPFITGANEYVQDMGRFDNLDAAYEYITHHPKHLEALNGFSPAACVQAAIASALVMRR